MATIFKKQKVWFLVFFVALLVSVGFVLFGESSEGKKIEVETEGRENEAAKAEKLSDEEAIALVRDIEAGNDAPGEGEQTTNNEQQTTGDGEQTTNNEQQTTGDGGQTTQTTDNEQQTTGDDEEGAEAEEWEGQARGDVKIINRLVSWGFAGASGRKIDTVVIHSTYNALGGDPFSVSKVLDIYKSYGVAPHYLVARDGAVYRLVDEKNVAYHAGESRMKDGRTNVNGFSIGIEIIEKDDGSPTEEQYVFLKKLIDDIERRHAIEYVVGHSDIAPGRKTDPWGFEWGKIQLTTNN